MIPAQHVADGGRRLAELFIVGQLILVHSVQDTALTGLHSVPYIRQSAGYDNGHGIFDKGFTDLFLHIHVDDFLFGIGKRMNYAVIVVQEWLLLSDDEEKTQYSISAEFKELRCSFSNKIPFKKPQAFYRAYIKTPDTLRRG
jgi:hypothetical protein